MRKIGYTVLLALLMSSLSSFAQRTIQFAGIEWYVKDGFAGPGPNYWSDSSKSVWVDSNGFLHLKIRKIRGEWHCSEIYSKQKFGYGEYKFHVASNVEKYASNIIVGLFVYENDSSEIDIEFPNRDSQSMLGWYTVQPSPYDDENHERFALNLSGDYSTHKFIWRKDNIEFESYHGHADSLPSPGYLINEWTYDGDYIPKAGKASLHINFWLNEGQAPGDRKDAELTINWVHIQPQKEVVQDYIGKFEGAFPFEGMTEE
ncbi:glycoside hydrolase family 16 protein [Mangrovibacterium lignilyticum]|uniref:glycoside hydrolase family 16 protein n=1 Tax=Mangrovibacterium lignilyticum TaxID=2668052 RepID=UPI0013D76FB4|nr:glycoside hydrolase family 16 protein [Mangrovibacterium lignilyticum]